MRGTEKTLREPRRDDEGDGERNEHTHARVDGDGAHVRTHHPETKAIGNSAAITVTGAWRGAPPTSPPAAGMRRVSGAPGSSRRCRWMFSITTMASSTRIPIEKINANKDTRLSV